MGKHRMIDSKIRSSQTFAKLSYRQRDLWQGMIETADDQGRMPGDATYIRSTVWPYDDIAIPEVEKDIQAIQEAGNILCYSVGSSQYVQLINWHKYQDGAEWLGLSDYPAPPGWTDHARYHSKGNKIVTLNWDTRFMDELPSQLPSDLPGSDVNGDGDGDVNGDKRSAPDIVFPKTLNCDAFKTTWQEWLTYRAQIKHKITPVTQKKQFAQLAKFPSAVAIAMLEQSMTNGWQGIFELKNTNSFKSSGTATGKGNGYHPKFDPQAAREMGWTEEQIAKKQAELAQGKPL